MTLSTLSGEQNSFQGQKRQESHWGGQKEAKSRSWVGSGLPSFLAGITLPGFLPTPKERLIRVYEKKSMFPPSRGHILLAGQQPRGVSNPGNKKSMQCNPDLPTQVYLSLPLQHTHDFIPLNLHNPSPIFQRGEATPLGHNTGKEKMWSLCFLLSHHPVQGLHPIPPTPWDF